jgi:hypothetical protein
MGHTDMSPERPSIFTAAATGYRDAGRALRAMPFLTLTLFGIFLALALLDLLAERLIPAESLFGRDIMSIIGNFLLTPFYIAVHRYVILGEITTRYRLDPLSVRFQLFFGWVVVVVVLSRVSNALAHAPLPQHVLAYVAVFVLSVAVAVLATRMIILFPAIAVAAPGATWHNAVRDTKGHFWYITFLILAAILPGLILAAAIAVSGSLLLGSRLGRLFVVLVAFVAGAVIVPVLVAVASRLYQLLGNRVNQPPPP